MIISLVLTLLVTASGTIATYLYDEGASFATRVCTGACIGITALGLLGFVVASFLGLTSTSILITAALLTLPFLILKDTRRRKLVRGDGKATWQALKRNLFNPSGRNLGYALFYAAIAAILWRVFDRAMIESPEGLATGVLNNFGDLPFHISVITSFAFGNNFPPEDPTYAGVHFTYPFLTDFVSAIFVRCGASLRQSMFLENFVLAFSLVVLVHRWALELLKDRLAAIVTPVLVLLNGGCGWLLLWTEMKRSDAGLLGALKALPPSVTVIPDTTWRWGNAVSTLLVPQRGMLLGLALAVIVFTQWWLSEEKVEEGNRVSGKSKKAQKKNVPTSSPTPVPLFPFYPFLLSQRRMIAAGLVAGALPLVHAHSFMVVLAVGAGIALCQRRWRDWIVFFSFASLLALPQVWWSTHNSAVDARTFFDWQFGWDRGTENAVWFWLKNTGIFIPLIVLAILWRGKNYLISRRLLVYYLPFTLCFIVPNFIKLAPWVWDNIKVLYYWWLASAPLVALLLARLWQQRGVKRLVAFTLFVLVILAGSLDVASILTRSTKFGVFDPQGIAFAEMIKKQTDPRSLIVHAPVHNHPAFLAGRRSLLGYPGHIWTHGLEFAPRENEIKRIYSGSSDAEALLR
ncbi:MAG TPA: hypothetical protein VFV61_04585, partial [Pyrinomonadaceae bacterium]|nr:hypothetical protein [Pyrinomonadaceae bacterium]